MNITTASQAFMIAAFSAIASLPLLIFGFSHLNANYTAMGVIELVAAAVVLTNLLVYLRTRNAPRAKFFLTFAVTLVLNVVLITGGIWGTGIFWWLMFPVAAFFLNGRKLGVLWIIAVYGFSFTMMILDAARIVPVAYDIWVVRQMWVVMLVISALAYVYERNSEERNQTLFLEREKLFAILESLPVGVFLAQVPTGNYVVINRAANELLGRTVNETRRTEQLIRSYGIVRENGTPYPFKELPLSITLRTGRSAEKRDVFVNRPDGTRIALHITSEPIRDAQGTMRFVAVMLRDVTKEREIDQMKSEFVALASHQLRTPLTGIKWFTELLLSGKGAAGKLKPVQKEYVQQIEDINGHLLNLVSDLLDVSHIETGRKFNLVMTPTDLRPILKLVVTNMSGIAALKQVKIRVSRKLPKSLVLTIDGDKMREVFENLISNAVKYSNKGSVVEIGFDGSNKKEAVIYVKDSGVGIPLKQQQRIFQKFFRAENAMKSGVEGTGLGLYIVKSITEKQDGRVWFESVENKGTTFYVALPW